MKTAELTEEELIAAKKELASIKKKQDALREKELAIRSYIADIYHTEEEGSKTVTVGEVKLKISRTLNRSITRDEAERLTHEHSDVALEALSWRPEVKTSAYRDHQKVLDEYITTKPGPPSIEFK